VPKTTSASQSGVQALSIFMPSPSSRSKAEPIGNKVATQSFYFFDYETFKCFLKINP
jgi:hypothetical protein